MRGHRGALAFATLLLAGCASAPPGRTPPAAEAEIVAAANGLFAAMLSRDTVALRAMMHPELRITSLRGGSGDPQVRVATVDEFVASIGRGGEPLYERMWDPPGRDRRRPRQPLGPLRLPHR